MMSWIFTSVCLCKISNNQGRTLVATIKSSSDVENVDYLTFKNLLYFTFTSSAILRSVARTTTLSLVRMRDMDPPAVPLRQAPYNTPQDVSSNSRSLVQVAEQAHPLVQRCPSPNPMREHRNNRTHAEAVVGGGATPHG